MTWQFRGPINGREQLYQRLSARDLKIIKTKSSLPIALTEEYRTSRRPGEFIYYPDDEPGLPRRFPPSESELDEWWDKAEESMLEGMLYMDRRVLVTDTPTRSAFRKSKSQNEAKPGLKVSFSNEISTVYYRLFSEDIFGRRKPEVHYVRRFDCYGRLDDPVNKTFDKLAEEDDVFLYGEYHNDSNPKPNAEEKNDEGRKSPVRESKSSILTGESGAFTRMLHKADKNEVDTVIEAAKQATIVSAKAVMDELKKTGTPPFMFHPISPPPSIETPVPVSTKFTTITRSGDMQVPSLEAKFSATLSMMPSPLPLAKDNTHEDSAKSAPGCQSATNCLASITHVLDNHVIQAPGMDTAPQKEIDDDLPIKRPVINSWLGDDATGTVEYRSGRDREPRQEPELEVDVCEDEDSEEERESHLVLASTTNDHNPDKATDTDLDEESIDSDVTLIADFAVNDILNDVKENPEEESETGSNSGTLRTLPFAASMSSSNSSTHMPKRFIPLELPKFPRTPTPRPFHNMLKRPNYLKFFTPNKRIDNERTTPKPPKIRAPKIHPEISADATKPKSISAFKSFKTTIQSAFRCMFACVSKQ